MLDEYMEAFIEPFEIQGLKRVIQNTQSGYNKEVSTP